MDTETVETADTQAPKKRGRPAGQKTLGVRLISRDGNVVTEWRNLSQAARGTELTTYTLMQRIVGKVQNADGSRFETYEVEPKTKPKPKLKPTGLILHLKPATMAALDALAESKDMTLSDYVTQLLDHNYGKEEDLDEQDAAD